MLIGKRLNDRYKIISLIGGGGMANVYLARDMILERDVAVKVLRLDFANDDQFIKRFRREAQAATSLNHEHIVSIYDVGEEEGVYYIVMEYVRGATLKQYIQQHAPLPVERALGIMDQLTSAIAHAHENGIIHRDIKPQNILLDEHGNVKVTDFGIAVAMSGTTITQTNSVLGSVHYLSPEQARGGIATEKSDIYSLGIVMFELVTGRLPFSGESAVSIVLKHLQAETPSPKAWNPDIPQSVENIILKATAKDPFYRYQSAREMNEDIRTALDPRRRNEPKFTIPDDDEEATKAIPMIKHAESAALEQETLVYEEKTSEPVHTTGEPKPKRKRVWIAWLVAALLFIGAAGISAVTWIPDLIFPKEVTMPNVVNKNYDDAVEQLSSLGLEIKDTIDVEDDQIEEGKVVRTDPEAGMTVKKGAGVIIYKSIGKKKIEFPSFIGDDIAAAEEELRAEGFTRITRSGRYSDKPEGTILDQYPYAGDEVVPDETEVMFTVSLGPEKVTVKDLTGYTEKSVRDYGADQGLRIDVKYEYSDEVPEGLVISQTPAANERVKKGETITVVISRGPEPKPSKTVVKEIMIPYEPAMPGQMVEAQLYIQDATHNMSTPYKTYRLTAPATEMVEFEIPYGETAYYRVIVNNVVKEEGSIPYPENNGKKG
ncbi:MULTISPECIES: Stk1 family PASTA domain-containing Ser/Thr kinase [Geobacillus]|uniref:Serine/threonine-protein kinase PrkC n=4 Tax=Geobacillus thermoleovorans group TaxID=1505648 RepID=Q5L0R9_GEOKA|nr:MULTISPECIES: Stk1 family PASTA domain-containing Ser/Thr kinase [Geobacillus]AEV18677.1 Serine/threonine protein kinase with PASTA sensors [Geobacillus thermoleovorans CCB_US3_UF5]AMV10406.1 serine/threonine protein kinase [Geobacillus thermoleovorans]AOL36220.1 serine/threonine protein kinase [Geobacillus thermoleovorans]AWO76359.1 Stk1 family PASTA domain-containing Ser/Thr kinase [Geobacillus thermoleovorans]KDE49484.1 serine/threonine protein kinase [Geobacillus sp. CAMR5420]